VPTTATIARIIGISDVKMTAAAAAEVTREEAIRTVTQAAKTAESDINL
jgi:hypothetical protein